MKLRNLAKILASGSLVAVTSVQAASAQFAPQGDNNFAALLGDPTAGAETGVYELEPLILGAGLAIVTLTVIMVGIVFARKVVRKFTG